MVFGLHPKRIQIDAFLLVYVGWEGGARFAGLRAWDPIRQLLRVSNVVDDADNNKNMTELHCANHTPTRDTVTTFNQLPRN